MTFKFKNIKKIRAEIATGERVWILEKINGPGIAGNPNYTEEYLLFPYTNAEVPIKLESANASRTVEIVLAQDLDQYVSKANIVQKHLELLHL